MIWIIVSYIIFAISIDSISRVYPEVPRKAIGILVIILAIIGWAVASPAVPSIHTTQLARSGHPNTSRMKAVTASYQVGIYHVHLTETHPFFVEEGGDPTANLEAIGRGPFSFNKSEELVTGLCGTISMPCPGKVIDRFSPNATIANDLNGTNDPLSVKRAGSHSLLVESKEGIWRVTIGSGISLWRTLVFVGAILLMIGLGERRRFIAIQKDSSNEQTPFS